MSRQQAPERPPGLLGSPASDELLLGWAIPMLAALVAVAAGGCGWPVR
jgi:hypothetical protein